MTDFEPFQFEPSRPIPPPDPIHEDQEPLQIIQSRTNPSVEYRFFVMNERHIEGACYVLADVFCNSPTEPFTFRKFSWSSNYEFIRLMLPSRVKEGLSLVVLDNEGRVAAAFFHEDSSYLLNDAPLPEGVDELFASDRGWKIALKLLEACESKYFRFVRDEGFERVVHLFQWGVLRPHRGNGLARVALQLTREIALQKGYQAMFAECTNYFSASFCERNGAKEVGVVDYGGFDFVEEDGTVSKGIFDDANEVALRWLKTEGLYKESYEEHIAEKCVVYHWDLREDAV